ncbi:MAG: type II secretion system F family protein [Betaproteobacteria bacterium]|nr:MAG: type II secretion system F family protein [Betaproteobacteria bacterium]
MPFFAYRGRNARGELVRGVLENSDSGAVADQLLTTGVSPIEITPTAGPQALAGEGWLRRLGAESVTLEDMLLFSRQMYTLLKSGVPILRSLAALQESATRSGFAKMLQDLRESLDSGRDLSTAMRRHPKVFDPFYLSMVRVGELTGALEEIFLRLFNHLDFEREIKNQVRQALRYPIFVIVVMAVAVVIVNIFVIPAFARIFAGFKAELPLMTRVLLGFSDFMVQYWPALLGVTAGAYVLFRIWVGTPAGRYSWDRMRLRVPVAGKIVLKATLARFARSLSIALKSGVPIVQALSVVEQVVDNTYVGQRIDQIRGGVERGESLLRTSVTTGVFTPVVLQMISVGEETGQLDDLLREVAEMYQREVEYELKTLSTQIEPILIVLLGVLVLMLALGVFLPMWDLGQAALAGGNR